MLPRLYFYWAALAFFAVITLIPAKASAHKPGTCLTFQAYDSETGTVGIRNACSECRKAVIRWCDGSALPLKVSRSEARRVQGFPGCMMRIAAEERCGDERPRHAVKKSEKRSPQVKKDSMPAAVSANSERPLLKPCDDTQTARAVVPAGQVAIAAKEAGVPPAINSMQAASEPPRTALVAPTPGRGAVLRPAIGDRTPIQRAAFPDASDGDWDTLLCTESGQSLIRQTEALLSRRAILQVMQGEIWFSPEAVEKLEEWIAADKEVQAINRELDKFQERAKTIIANAGQP